MNVLALPQSGKRQVANAELKFDPLMPQPNFFLLRRHDHPLDFPRVLQRIFLVKYLKLLF